MSETKTQWFASWFNTPYYHTLYKERNDSEAKLFMGNITEYLNLPENGKILDLACGKGRHSIHLNSLGYNVTGVDLAEESIKYANQYKNETLRFNTHDMREAYGEEFDAVFNLFTSFGYFDDDNDHLKTIKAIKADLNETGFGVIDFMNVDKVIPNLVATETKTIDGITFSLKRYVENGYITKEIKFTDNGNDFTFYERVKAITLSDFEAYFEKAGIYLLDIFGDYNLNKFHKNTSDRLILVFK